MKIMRKLSLPLIIVLIANLTLTAQAAVDADLSKKVENLNKLNIMTDGTLDAQVLRCHAAAIIVRMLGKDAYVLQNKEKYKVTKFTDVKATEWYAPYIGYCTEQNILTGVGSKFSPMNNISEKEFIKIALCALGYVYNADFTWKDVFKAAYNVGLVTEASYLTRTADLTKYTRRFIVVLLNNMLKLKTKGTDITVIKALVDNNVVTRETALATGLMMDSVKTAIDSITPINESKVVIKFNEDIAITSNTKITINESQNVDKVLTNSIEAIVGKEMTLKVSMQTPEKIYSVLVSSLVDIEGNPTAVLMGTFTGFKAPEIKSDFFKISKVEAVNNKTVNLYFTHPLNINSEVVSNYEILDTNGSFVKGSSQTLAVKKMTSVNNGVTIYLKDRIFVEGGEYTLNVSGNMSSAYGVKLSESKGDSAKFIGKASQNEELKLINIAVLNTKTVMLEFNKEINPILAQQVFNYYITDANNVPMAITQAVVSGEETKKGKCVRLTVAGVFEKTKNYNIVINNLNDNTRQYSIIETKYPFSGVYPDKTDVQIVNIAPSDIGTLVVYFDRPLDEESANIPSNYLIAGITQPGYMTTPAKAYYNSSVNPYMVKLYLPNSKNLESSGSYKIQIQTSLKDYLGNFLSKVQESGFNSVNITTVKPLISEAVIIAPDTIRIKFNREVALDAPNILNSNYTLEYSDSGSPVTIIPTSVTYYDNSIFLLRFDGLDYTQKYTLKFKSLKDYPGIYTTTQTDGSNSIQVVLGK